MSKFCQRTATIKEIICHYSKKDIASPVNEIAFLDSIADGQYVQTVVIHHAGWNAPSSEKSYFPGVSQGQDFVNCLSLAFIRIDQFYVDLRTIVDGSKNIWRRGIAEDLFGIPGRVILDAVYSADLVAKFADSLDCIRAESREIESMINCIFETIRATKIPLILI